MMGRRLHGSGESGLVVLLVAWSLLAASPSPARAGGLRMNPPATRPERAAGRTAFVHVHVVSPIEGADVADATVLVEGDRIAAVGPSSEVQVPDGFAAVDGGGGWITPGLVDAHVHLDPMVGARPDFGDGPLYLAYGITSVFNLRGDPDILSWRDKIRDGSILAPNLYSSGEFVNEPRVRTPSEAESEVASQARQGVDLIKFREVIDFERHRVATTKGMERGAYLRLMEAAREAGIPVVGHAPYRVGLDGLLEARMSLAHINELANLYFLPPLDLRGGLSLSVVRWSFLALAVLLALWALASRIVRARGRGWYAPSPLPGRMRRRCGLALLASLGAAALWILAVPPGPFFGSLPLLAVLSLLALSLAWLALRIAAGAAASWREPGLGIASRAAAGLCAGAVLVLAASVGYWSIFAWRGTDASIHRVAKRCKSAGIWVQSTLLLQEMAVGRRDGYRMDQLKADPDLRFLPAELREGWMGIPAFAPPWMGRLWVRHPEFDRRLLRALHEAGVPVMAGTDAMGVPFDLPGSSLHRELRLLSECGFTNREVLWSATAAPAAFLGRQSEFGAVRPGLRADLLLLEADPMKDLGALRRPAGVMVRGVWLPRTRLDAEAARLAGERP